MASEGKQIQVFFFTLKVYGSFILSWQPKFQTNQQKKIKANRMEVCVDFYKLNAVKDSNTSYVNMYFTHKPIPMPKSSLCLISTVGFGRSV